MNPVTQQPLQSQSLGHMNGDMRKRRKTSTSNFEPKQEHELEVEVGEAKDAQSLLSRIRNYSEEFATRKNEMDRASKELQKVFLKAQGKLRNAVLGVSDLVTDDLVCLEIEVEWPDDDEYYRAFVCDARNSKHLLAYIDEVSGDVSTEELDLRKTKRKWRYAVPRQHSDHLVGRRCIIDPTEDDTDEERYKKTVFVLARREGDTIRCPECEIPEGIHKNNLKAPCRNVHHTIMFVEDSWVVNFNFADNDYIVARTI